MQEYEVLKPLEVTDEAHPLFGSHDEGATVSVEPVDGVHAEGVLESIAEWVEQGFLKLISNSDALDAAQAQAPVPQTPTPNTNPPAPSPTTQARVAPAQAAVGPAPAPVVPATAELQAKFPAPPAPYDGLVPAMEYYFCKGIEAHEVCAAPGTDARFPQGTRAYFDKNPGNLKYRQQIGSVGEDKDGFAIFPELGTGAEGDGFMALVRQVNAAIKGGGPYPNPIWDATLKAWRHLNFLDFFKIYDSSAGDDPVAYANDVAAFMSKIAGVDVSVETVINQLV